jgi:putative N-acetylmannosamine-6-phosphate epimerase
MSLKNNSMSLHLLFIFSLGFLTNLMAAVRICPRHGASTTPTIDKHLRQFHVNDRLQALAPGTTALDGQGCTRCTVEAVTSVLSGYTRDLKAAKKSGQLTKQERKAMKAEAKAMSKEIKKDLKATWKKAA